MTQGRDKLLLWGLITAAILVVFVMFALHRPVKEPNILDYNKALYRYETTGDSGELQRVLERFENIPGNQAHPLLKK